MKLPYFKSRYYLSGIDWVISAIDYYMRLTTPAGNHSTLIIELNTPCNEDGLKQRIESIFTAIPLFNAFQGRDIFNLAPFWKVNKNNPVFPQIRKVECNTQEEFSDLRAEVLNQSFNSKRDHLFFTVASGKMGNFLFMTFDHKLFDARGAELFLNLLSEQEKNQELIPQIKTSDSPKLKDWNEKFKAGRDIQRHLIKLSQNKYVALSKHSMNNPPEKKGPNLDSQTVLFSKKQTEAILAKAEKLAGFMMETPFLLAVTALAIHEIISPDKEASYSVPMPVDMRKPGSEMQKMLFNHLSFMFLNIKVSSGLQLKDLICEIRNAIFYNIEQELPEKLIKATRLARISPLPILKKFMKLPLDGKVASFAFANVGESPTLVSDIMGNMIKNISHMPRIPTPPGLGIFFNLFAGKKQFTLTWDKNAIEKETVCGIISKMQELLEL